VRNKGTQAMNLPKIDVSSLPDLSAATGVFGSLVHKGLMFADDSWIVVMVFLYDATHR